MVVLKMHCTIIVVTIMFSNIMTEYSVPPSITGASRHESFRIPCRRRKASRWRAVSWRSSSKLGGAFNSSHNLMRRSRSWRLILRRAALSSLDPKPVLIKKLQFSSSFSILASFFLVLPRRGAIAASKSRSCCSRSKMASFAVAVFFDEMMVFVS
jgi:hypothetical protein